MGKEIKKLRWELKKIIYRNQPNESLSTDDVDRLNEFVKKISIEDLESIDLEIIAKKFK